MNSDLYSVKMRASRSYGGQEQHISGAEKIVGQEQLNTVVNQLLERALHHAKGNADLINLKIETVPEKDIMVLDALPVTTCQVDTAEEGIRQLKKLMEQSGITNAEQILKKIGDTYAMRGAMLLHVDTLERLEPDPERGIRATYMDVAHSGDDRTQKNHFKEALVLATKVASQKNIIGEVCISDDPDYVTGYFASKELGYVRITKLKEMGSPNGGRIFLFRGTAWEAEECIQYLQQQKILVRIPDRGAVVK